MFRKTSQKQQIGIFTSPNSFLNDRSERFYEQKTSWHNLFREQVTLRIEEALFEPLYSKETGSPNSPVRVMVAMMILKEASRWSDSQLFEQCRYNLLVRRALGLVNMDDAVPSESTYYLFRKRIVEHEREGNQNLLEETFISVTRGQAKDFQVSGRSIRMDSKLLGSNISWLSRYELVHETLRMFCSKTEFGGVGDLLSDPEKNLIEALIGEMGNKVVYRCSGDEINTRLVDLGILAYRLLRLFEGSSTEYYKLLSRLFGEQFDVDGDSNVVPKPKETISSDSLQSPHDPDCDYRNKDGNQVKGFSANVTESCGNNGLDLISGVDLVTAGTADNVLLEKGLRQAEVVFDGTADKIHADGAYHSTANQELARNQNAELILSAIQGAKGRYDLNIDQNGQLTVTDLKTGQVLEVLKMHKKEKWRIKTEEHYRYFTEKEIEACRLRKKIESIPQEILNIRNNVEATIFQLGYHYTNDKTRYRGHIKHKMWANIRCLWVNFSRIAKFVVKTGLGTGLIVKVMAKRLQFTCQQKIYTIIITEIRATLNLTRTQSGKIQITGFS